MHHLTFKHIEVSKDFRTFLSSVFKHVSIPISSLVSVEPSRTCGNVGLEVISAAFFRSQIVANVFGIPFFLTYLYMLLPFYCYKFKPKCDKIKSENLILLHETKVNIFVNEKLLPNSKPRMLQASSHHIKALER